MRFNYWFVISCLLGVALFSLSYPQWVSAQTTLEYAVPVEGRITGGGNQQWQFIARDGAMLSFRVQTLDDTLDPIIEIEDNNGNILLHNDDYNYPDSPDALIEGFTAPRIGTYTIVIRGYGNTSGTYRLTMLPGYSHNAYYDDFTSDAGWQAHDDASVTVNGRLMMMLEGIQKRDYVLADRVTVGDTFYASVEINVTGREGWYVGYALQAGDGAQYILQMNQRGAWQFLIAQDSNDDRIIKDWQIHPAITPERTSFTLSLLGNASGFEIYYDHNYVGVVEGDLLQHSDNKLGFFVGTPAIFGSSTLVEYDNLLITAPMQVNGRIVLPDQLLQHRNAATMTRELSHRHLAPLGGSLIFSVEQTSARNVEAGVSRFPLARGSAYADFAFSATIDWQPDSNGESGCGLVLRETDEAYALVYVDSNGAFGLTQYDGQGFTHNTYRQLNTTVPYTLLVIALDNTLHFYAQGHYIGTQTAITRNGGVGQAVVNFDAVDTDCQFRDIWLWRYN